MWRKLKQTCILTHFGDSKHEFQSFCWTNLLRSSYASKKAEILKAAAWKKYSRYHLPARESTLRGITKDLVLNRFGFIKDFLSFYFFSFGLVSCDLNRMCLYIVRAKERVAKRAFQWDKLILIQLGMKDAFKALLTYSKYICK